MKPQTLILTLRHREVTEVFEEFVFSSSAGIDWMPAQLIEGSQSHMAWTVTCIHDVSSSALNHCSWRHCCHDKHGLKQEVSGECGTLLIVLMAEHSQEILRQAD